jgi:hypothetical protein
MTTKGVRDDKQVVRDGKQEVNGNSKNNGRSRFLRFAAE